MTTLFCRRNGLIAWPLLVVALGLWPNASQAAPRTATISKSGGPGADKAAALVGHYLRQNISKDDRFELAPWGAYDRDRAIKSFQEAEEAALRAREAYDSLDLDVAQSQAQVAMGRYERFAAYVDDFKKVAETLMLLGAVHILRGDERGGTQVLEQAINVFGQVEPDPRVFNPAMRAQFSQVAAKLASRPGGTLSVATTPGYAEVFVDGQFSGISPVAVQNVSEGRHFVRLRKEGMRPVGKVMQVISRNETTDSAQLRPAPHYEELDGLTDRVVAQIDEPGSDKDKEDRALATANRRALGQYLHVDTLFVSRVRLDGERVHISAAQIDAKSGRVLRRGEHVFAYDTRKETYDHEVAVMLHDSFGAEASAPYDHRAIARPSTAAEDKKMLPHAGGQVRCMGGRVSCRALKLGLGSTLVTVGAGVLIGGAVEYVMAANTHREWLAVTQVDSRQGVLRARGRNQALTGDVLMGIGAALTLTSSLTFALWHPTPSAADVARAQHTAPQSHVGAPEAGQLQVSMWPHQGGGSVQASVYF